MFEQVFDRAVLCDQFLRSLRSNAGDAGNIVGGIAREAENVSDLLDALDLPVLEHFGNTHNFRRQTALGGFIDEGVCVNELGEIFVRRDHVGVEAFFLCTTGERADQVVGFKTLRGDDRNIERFQEFLNAGNGGADFFGSFLTLCFVFGKFVVAERRPVNIEGDGDVRRTLFLDQFEQGVEKAEDGGNVAALRIDHRIAHEGEVRPVNQRHAVEKEKFFAHAPESSGFYRAIQPLLPVY